MNPIWFSALSHPKQHAERNFRPNTIPRKPRPRFREVQYTEPIDSPPTGVGFNCDVRVTTPVSSSHPRVRYETIRIPMPPPKQKMMGRPGEPQNGKIENSPGDLQKPYDAHNYGKLHNSSASPAQQNPNRSEPPTPHRAHKPFQRPPINRVIIANTGEVLELPHPPETPSLP